MVKKFILAFSAVFGLAATASAAVPESFTTALNGYKTVFNDYVDAVAPWIVEIGGIALGIVAVITAFYFIRGMLRKMSGSR